jgi:5-methylcytosine-specific restriction endonuclease McrA
MRSTRLLYSARLPGERARTFRKREATRLARSVPGAVAAGIRRELRRQLFEGRERVPCCFCARELTFEEATLEHIRPKSRGGPTTIENLTLSCEPCNSARGEMGYEKFRGRTGQSHA